MGKKKINIDKGFIISTIVIISIAMVITGILIAVSGTNPFYAYYSMLQGAFGNGASIINTLNKAIPICFAGFAVGISRRAGIFNIGVEGQLMFGAFGGTITGIYLTGLPMYIHISLCIIVSMLFGAAYALIPTLLFVKRKANILVVFILSNSIAGLLITYFVNGPFLGKETSTPATDFIQKSAFLPYILKRPARLSIGILIMIIVAVLLNIYLSKSTSGYEMKVCGQNKEAAKFAGINVKKYIYIALLLGGAIGGLAGGVEVLGNYHKLYDGFSPGYGFDAIPIAILANGNPFGIIIGAIIFGAIRTGSVNMQANAGVSNDIVQVIQGILIILIACDYIIKQIIKRKKSIKIEKNVGEITV